MDSEENSRRDWMQLIDRNGDFVKAVAEEICLKKIAETPTWGYDLIEHIRKVHGVYLGPSTIYPILIRMEKYGFISSHWDVNSSKPRKIYTITQDGLRELNYSGKTLCELVLKVEMKTQ
jgi:PadR family transcriptional regulator, regulatory protein PadR